MSSKNRTLETVRQAMAEAEEANERAAAATARASRLAERVGQLEERLTRLSGAAYGLYKANWAMYEVIRDKLAPSNSVETVVNDSMCGAYMTMREEWEEQDDRERAQREQTRAPMLVPFSASSRFSRGDRVEVPRHGAGRVLGFLHGADGEVASVELEDTVQVQVPVALLSPATGEK